MIIPARYSSARLPGKMLLPIAGKPLILHTVMRANEAATVDEVIVATDDERIRDVVLAAGFKAVMTSAEHQSGSDRIAEVARDLPEGSIIVNVQGDEPVIAAETIDRAVTEIAECGVRSADFLVAGEPGKRKNNFSANAEGNESAIRTPQSAIKGGEPEIVTTFERIGSVEELENPNVVKVVTNAEGRALYFSRSPMPFPREAAIKHGGSREAFENEPELFRHHKKHTGLYVYRREFLLEYTKMPQTPLEKLEMLEQLRALENGAYIKVVEAAGRSIGVDTAEDLERVRAMLNVHQTLV